MVSRRLLGLLSASVFNEARGIIVGNNPITGFEDSPKATKDAISNFVEEFLLPEGIHSSRVFLPFWTWGL